MFSIFMVQQTKDSLETSETLLEKLELNQLSPVEGVKQSLEVESNQANIINQLQLELGEVKATLEDERVRGRGLEEQLADRGKQERRRLKRVDSSASHDSVGHTRVRHQDAILQLQLELDTIDGAPESAIRSYRWEEGTRDEDEMDDVEVKHSATIMQLQLDLESVESRLEEERSCLKEVEASRARLQKQLEDAVSQLHSEKEAVILLRSCQSRTENELDSLRIDHKVLLEKVRKTEEKESNLKQKVTQLEWELSREQELRSIEVREQAKYGPVDDGRKLAFNAEVEKVLEQEIETTRPEVELKAALGNTSIPLELSELRDEVAGAMEREAAARNDVARLSDLLKDKEAEICTVQQDWEGAAAKLIDYLAAGKLSVDAACSKFTQELFNTSLSRGKKMETDRIVCKVLEKQTAVMTLTKQLQDARRLADSFRSKLGDSLSNLTCDYGVVHSSRDLDENVKQSMLQAHQDSMALKVEVESCDAYLREVESKSTIAFIMVWWLSETAGLRCVAEDRMRVEFTEAAAKIQERQGVLFSLQLEREKTPEKESQAVYLEAERVHRELAAWEEERIRLAAKNLKFETQVRQIEKILEHLHVQLQTAEQRLQQATQKSSEIAKAQTGLAIAKGNWNLKKSASMVAVTESELQYTRIKEELSATKVELQRLEARTRAAEVREDELQNERAKLEKELKQHLEAVQVLADDLQNQVI